MTRPQQSLFTKDTKRCCLIEAKKASFDQSFKWNHTTYPKKTTSNAINIVIDFFGKKKLSVPSSISHSNWVVLCVLKKSYTYALLKQKGRGPSFICHPNGTLLQVLNQNAPVISVRKQSTSAMMDKKIDTEVDIVKATRFKAFICVLNQKYQYHHHHCHHYHHQQQHWLWKWR